jgi:hypothetical protein
MQLIVTLALATLAVAAPQFPGGAPKAGGSPKAGGFPKSGGFPKGGAGGAGGMPDLSSIFGGGEYSLYDLQPRS